MSEWCLFDYIVAWALFNHEQESSWYWFPIIFPRTVYPSLSPSAPETPSITNKTNQQCTHFIFYDIVLLVYNNKLLWAFKCHNIIIIIIIIIIITTTVNSHGFLSL